MVIAAWGEGVNVLVVLPLPLARSLVACPKACATTLAVSTDMPPSPQASTPPHLDLTPPFGYISNKSHKDLDDLMGEPPWFFYTCVRRILTYWFNSLNTYEIGVNR
jgi:hypothetical protein